MKIISKIINILERLLTRIKNATKKEKQIIGTVAVVCTIVGPILLLIDLVRIIIFML